MLQWGRILILAAMLVTSYLLILAWQKDHIANTAVTQAAAAPQMSVASTADVPTAAPAHANSDLPIAPGAMVAKAAAVPANHLVMVQTDVYRLWLDLNGGDIVRLELLQHDAKAADGKTQPFVLLQQDAQSTYIAQTGLLSAANSTPIDNATSARPTYSTTQAQYTLAPGQNELVISLVYHAPNQIDVQKIYTVKRATYPIAITQRLVNLSKTLWQGQMFAQLKRDDTSDPSTSSQGMMGLSTYLGGAWGDAQKQYSKLKFSKFSDEALNQPVKGGWLGIVQHYFVTAWIPDPALTVDMQTRNVDQYHFIGFKTPVFSVTPGHQHDVSATLYSGPKIQSELKTLAPGLNKTVDYGWLWPIAQVLFTMLNFIHGVLGNWGWSIIALTFIVKMVLFPLSAKSYRSMAKMKILAPEMQRLKEEHGEDRMKLSQEMMALYRREQVNPMSGCLPMLLQMPIFLALYWVLMESVELRHAPWMGWIQDLSSMDPYFILPLLQGATMYGQQMLSAQPSDPMQAKMMKLLPIIFTAFLLFFPAGLVLYWVVSNLLTIAQQSFINYRIKREEARKTALGLSS